MDPLSIATGVLGFVSFGFKLVSLYRQAHQQLDDGRPVKLTDLEKGLEDLAQNAADAKTMLANLNSSYPQHSKSIDRLSEECDLAHHELQKLAKGFTTRSGGGLRAQGARITGALHSLWKSKDFEQIEGRMGLIRQQMVLVLLLCTMDSVQNHRQESANTIESIEKLKSAVDNLQRNIHGKYSNGSAPTSHLSDSLKDGLWASIQVALQGNNDSLSDQASILTRNDPAINANILTSLEFDDMRARRNQVEEPFPNTFQWLMADPSQNDDESSEPRAEPTGFKEWLESPTNESPFWITGIPASGKSTLMKFICTHPDVRGHLQKWCNRRQLVTCNVYLWNAGTTFQKTQTGLLRTIVHEILAKKLDFCRIASPERYIYYQMAGSGVPAPPDWSVQELQGAISRLVSNFSEQCRLALFIDGLDEYEGDLKALVAYLKQLHREHDIKLCVSSRPWNTFRDEFVTYPSLKMESFNKEDIKEYVQRKVASSPAIEELRRVDKYSIEELESNIMDKAKGVFLWVVLVLDNLLITAEDNNDLAVIWKLFNSLPPGLEEVYDSITRRLSKSQLEGASKMYQLLFQWREVSSKKFQAWNFWRAINCQNPAELLQKKAHDELTDINSALERRVGGCTGGMLQITDHHVDFLHRTVFDWLGDRRAEIIRNGPPDYDASLILASLLASNLSPTIDLGEFYSFYARIRDGYHDSSFIVNVLESAAAPSKVFTFSGQEVGSGEFSSLLVAIRQGYTHYLRAKFDLGFDITGFEPGRWGFLSKILGSMPLRPNKKNRLGLICEAALGSLKFDPMVDRFDFEYTDTVRSYNAKIKTTELLLREKCIPVRTARKIVARKIKKREWPLEYWRAISDGLLGKGFSELADIGAMRRFSFTPSIVHS
ncbi:uncharacterized protein PgNI_07282 [Pyricularia grisea]|uniref:Nephrocystin 3-like N-terminal domain-containing protein n=1 Tax=Pyricularia grisea TaxID=148305 RepID=A0A6P8B3G6_PYRGI|nr:uncharacterized protein PgNI_07282 [Pyricularia grisea]TLD09359.1 hypothetical protein PgNI_07282 [Pyricularia grisea]